MNNLVHVYADTDVSEWNIKKLNNPLVNIYRDINEFIAVVDTNKHAVFHACFPYYQDQHNSFDDTVTLMLNHCKTISVLISEVHTQIVDFMNRFSQPQMRYLICGFAVGIDTYHWMDWFATTSSYYRQGDILSQLNPYTVKPKYFDILLGQPKPHRTRIYDYVRNNNLTDQVIMTYLTEFNTKSIVNHGTEGFIVEPEMELPEHDFNWTVTGIKYCDRRMSLSQVVPISIYNQTAYSIIAETNIENHYTFFTEKTCKPIMAERLFIMLGGRHYLKNLRQLGFQTFDGIIDESYDLEIDNNTRWSMAIMQMRYLMSQPQEEILTKIRPITEHNRRVMMETDWSGNVSNSLRNFFNN